MSSFRPAPTMQAPTGFVATSFEGLRTAFLSGPLATPAPEPEAEAEPATSPGSSAAEGAAQEAAPEPPILFSEQELAEREAAAFERGAEQARVEAAAIESAFAALEAAGRALEVAAATRPDANRAAIVELVADAAEAWAGARLREDDGAVLAAIESALALAEDRPVSRIQLHPGDLERLEQAARERLDAWRDGDRVAIGADPELAPGEHRIELEGGVVDGRLAALRASLVEALQAALTAPLPSPVSSSLPASLSSPPSSPEGSTPAGSEETE